MPGLPRSRAVSHCLSWLPTNERDFEQVFATISSERIGALRVGVEPFFWDKLKNSSRLPPGTRSNAVRPKHFSGRGGLMSYGTSSTEAERTAGLYVRRILKGAKRAALPVMQATKFEILSYC
jgi:putative ABC transport system substrate-binding protein